jgi:hypothetical protein
MSPLQLEFNKAAQRFNSTPFSKLDFAAKEISERFVQLWSSTEDESEKQKLALAFAQIVVQTAQDINHQDTIQGIKIVGTAADKMFDTLDELAYSYITGTNMSPLLEDAAAALTKRAAQQTNAAARDALEDEASNLQQIAAFLRDGSAPRDPIVPPAPPPKPEPKLLGRKPLRFDIN